MPYSLNNRVARLESRVTAYEPVTMTDDELRSWLNKFGWVVPKRNLTDDEMSRCFHLLFTERHKGPITDADLAAVEDYEQLFSGMEKSNASES